MYKVDLHTHSIISQDGGITVKHYEKILALGILDCIAITDHNEVRFARQMRKEFGDKIIVGEEISTQEGEIIGLFLEKKISAGLRAKEAIAQIRLQGGLVYIPHPFETFRKGVQEDVLQAIVKDVDIIEVFNGRGRWRGKPMEAYEFAKTNTIVMAGSSDSHIYSGLGSTFSIVKEMPTQKSLKRLLKEGEINKKHAPVWTLLSPFMNKIKNKVVLGI